MINVVRKILMTMLGFSLVSLTMAASLSKAEKNLEPQLNANTVTVKSSPSTPGQLNWQPSSTTFTFSSKISVLAADNKGNLYVATIANKLYKSSDAGKTWTQVGRTDLTPYLLNNKITHIAITQNGVIYVATYVGPIFKSTDGGKTWSNVRANSNLPIGAVPAGNTMMAVGNSIYLTYNDNNLYKSTANPSVWTRVPMPNNNLNLRPLSIYHDGSTIYMQVQDMSTNSNNLPLYKSTANSNTWVLVSQKNNAPMPLIREMYFMSQNNNNPSLIYATFYNGGAYGVSESKDGGQSWVVKNAGLGSVAPYLATIANHAIYVTTYNGVYGSVDGGNTWNTANTGLVGPSITNWQVPIIAIKNMLYLASCNQYCTAYVIYKANIN